MRTRRFIGVVALLILQPRGYGQTKQAFSFLIGQDVKSINDYITALKSVPSARYPDGFMVYTAINDLSGLSVAVDHGAGVNDADQLIQKYPKFQIVQIGLFMRYMLSEVIRGSFDDNIDQLAQWIKASHKQVYLRIGYEFDNPENGYDPLQYKQAYRYIVDRIRSKGVANVQFVWHSIAWKEEGWPKYDPLQWYPGDDYVDWIGISFFDSKRDEERQTIAHIAQDKNKPLMIAESSPFKQLSAQEKLVWMSKLFNYVNEYHVKVLSYINVNWDQLPLFASQQWGDGRLQKDPVLFQKWLKDISNEND